MYSKLADFYDKYIGFDYQLYEDIIKEIINKDDSCLDLACGSGTLVKILNKYTNDVIGSDLSSEMLSKAKEKNPYNDFFIHDLKEDFYIGDLKLITCTIDSINYLLKTSEVVNLFNNVNNNLQIGGYFLFDIYTTSKLSAMENYSYHEVYEDYTFIWDSYVEDDFINSYLTFYILENNLITRYDEVHIQRVYKKDFIDSLLKNYQIKKFYAEDRIIYLCKKEA